MRRIFRRQCSLMVPAAESPLGRRSALVLVTATAWSILTPVTTHAAVPSSARAAGSRERPRLAWVVGDSLTILAGSALRRRLASLVGEVEIDAVTGRPVAELDNLVKARLARGARPDVMVLALGTNPSPGWDRDDYARVVDTIPADVAVVLVTVYRSDECSLPATVRTMQHYSRSMRSVAAVRANVSTAPWRSAAAQHPGRLLVDCAHQTVRGARVWAWLVAQAVDRSWERVTKAG